MLHKPWLPPEDHKAYHCVLYFHLLLSSCSVFVTRIFCLTKTVHLGEIDRSPGRFQLLAKHRLSSTGIGQFSMDNHRALETALPIVEIPGNGVRASIRVPRVGADQTSSSPPIEHSLSFMRMKPRRVVTFVFSGCKPTPSSDTRSSSSLELPTSSTLTLIA